MFDLKGKVAVVTGANRGIGHSVAVSLAQAGADVALWARNKESLSATRQDVERYGVKTVLASVDVTDRAVVDAATLAAVQDLGRLDVAIVNAGIHMTMPFLDLRPEDWTPLIQTNLVGSIHTMQAVGRHMTEQARGSVIVMASIYGMIGAPQNSIYCLTKGGLLQLSRSLAVEWARHGVRVNSISPGWVETDLNAPYKSDQRVITAGLARIPLRRFGSPQEIGPLAVYLASDEARWVTGQNFVIDGGQSAQ
jgi:NAD(P)-dependent dehydrogenase (short-subunit alcohol dehydrogenase family)